MDPKQPFDAGVNVLIFPKDPTIGALGTFSTAGQVTEIGSLEAEREKRVWAVRAIISDAVSLSDDAREALARKSHHKLCLNENPLHIYLHHGGHRAIYYELVADEDGYLKHIEVRVESRLPSNAILLAKRPINALLDVLTRDLDLPLTIQRLELVSPKGTNSLRKWIRERCEERRISERLPPDPEVNPQELINLGLDSKFVAHIRRAKDLFDRLSDHRDAIAHFLITKEGQESHA